MTNPHEITRAFEKVVADYTGAAFACAIDNGCNAINLSLDYWMRYKLKQRPELFQKFMQDELFIDIPERTYPGVVCEVLNLGLKVKFTPVQGETITGEYRLTPSPVWDSALRFRSAMYRPGSFQCLSFTGPYKHLKLSKGGMILTDDEAAYKWFKKMRFSGRG